MKLSRTIFFLLVLVGIISFSQCRKSDRNDEKVNPAPYENAFAAKTFNDVFKTIHHFAIDDSLLSSSNGNTNSRDYCIESISYASIVKQYPNTVVLDFGNGTEKCSLDDKVRNGKWRIKFTGAYDDSASVATVTFTDYYVDSLKVTADMTITNRGRVGEDGDWLFKVVVKDGYVTGDTLDFYWDASRNYDWVSGSGSVATSDDKFEISGSSSGMTSKGNTYKSKINTALVQAFSCDYFESGIETLTPDNLSNRTIDYGTACSASVSVLYQNTEYSFTY